MEINLEKLKNYKIAIATPMYGGNCTAQYVHSLTDLIHALTKYGIRYELHTMWNEALITRARNRIVNNYLASDADMLLFIDSDIGFNWESVFEMMQIMVNSDKKIICATYPKKTINWKNIDKAYNSGKIKSPEEVHKYSADFVLNHKVDEKSFIKFKINEPVEVLESGTGFMLIGREVFNKFQEAYPEQWTIDPDSKNPVYYYFDCKIDPGTKYYLSEDYMFCRYADAIGYSTWILPWVYLTHTGPYIFSGSFAETAILEYELMTEQGDDK